MHDQQLAEACDILAAEGIVAELIEPGGDPAHAIERVAEQGRFDTIVVGSRGLNAAERFLQGSVSEHVATHASATVVVARSPHALATGSAPASRGCRGRLSSSI